MSRDCRCKCASFREHLEGVSFAISPRTKQVNATDRQWDTDGAAYTRLRREGHQPPQIDGCAALEAKARHPIEIEHGVLYGKDAGYADRIQQEIRGT